MENVKILGIKFGSESWENSQWLEKFLDFKKDVGFFKTKNPTLDAKSMLSKFKLCSIFSYISQVFPIPQDLEKKIEEMMLGFVVPHKHTFLTALDFSLPRRYGGYSISNIVLHANLCFLKPVMQYLNEKVNNDVLSESCFFVEYNLGQQLSVHFRLEKNNSTVHAFAPNQYHAKMYDIIKKYEISLEELVEGKVSQIYHRILCDIGDRRKIEAKYSRMHRSFFPSYLKTFNYKVKFDVLPVKGKLHKFCLDSEEKISCPFCNVNLESAFHIFSKCSKLMPLWETLDESIRVCFGGNCNYSFKVDRYQKCNYDIVNSKCQKEYENLIFYISSVINHNIWKKRNLIFHENDSFNVLELLKKICSTLCARKNMEKSDRLTSTKKVNFLHEYYVTLVSIRDAMFDPG